MTVSENIGKVNVTVLRKGDLGMPGKVKVVSKPDSAQGKTVIMWHTTEALYRHYPFTESEDYEEIEKTINFKPGDDTATITVTVVDDEINPVLEGNETFHLVLEEPEKLIISDPKNLPITITDNLDGILSSIHVYLISRENLM